MDKKRRKELQEEYSRIKIYIGVIQITNTIDGKVYIDSYPNLKNKWLTIREQLDMGKHPNFQLQKDWKELGSDIFTYEVIEEKEADKVSDVRWALKQMKKQWLDKLQPYGDRGYNKPPQ